MSKLSTLLHSHAQLVDDLAGLVGVVIDVLPLPSVVKDPLLGVVSEAKATADNMHRSADQVESDLLSDLLADVNADAQSKIQSAAASVSQSTSAVSAAIAPSTASYAASPAQETQPSALPSDHGTTGQMIETQPGDPNA